MVVVAHGAGKGRRCIMQDRGSSLDGIVGRRKARNESVKSRGDLGLLYYDADFRDSSELDEAGAKEELAESINSVLRDPPCNVRRQS